jgi:hypothetical protein
MFLLPKDSLKKSLGNPSGKTHKIFEIGNIFSLFGYVWAL